MTQQPVEPTPTGILDLPEDVLLLILQRLPQGRHHFKRGDVGPWMVAGSVCRAWREASLLLPWRAVLCGYRSRGSSKGHCSLVCRWGLKRNLVALNIWELERMGAEHLEPLFKKGCLKALELEWGSWSGAFEVSAFVRVHLTSLAIRDTYGTPDFELGLVGALKLTTGLQRLILHIEPHEDNTTLEPLECLTALTGLTSLLVKACCLHEGVSGLAKLQVLDIRKSKYEDYSALNFPVQRWKLGPSLTSLNLWGVFIDDAVFEYNHVVELSVMYCDLARSAAGFVLANCHCLERVYLSCSVDDVDELDITLEKFSGVPSLKSVFLAVSYYQIWDVGWQAFLHNFKKEPVCEAEVDLVRELCYRCHNLLVREVAATSSGGHVSAVSPNKVEGKVTLPLEHIRQWVAELEESQDEGHASVLIKLGAIQRVVCEGCQSRS